MSIKRICVYCASGLGVSPEYLLAAQVLGSLLAQRRSRWSSAVVMSV